jgi:2-methylcitrate dehydratase
MFSNLSWDLPVFCPGMDRPTRAIAEYLVGLRERDLPESSFHDSARHLVDSLGCALGALQARPARVARAIAATAAVPGGASVMGLGHCTTPEYAAFANTVMVRYLDFNDTGLGGHPSDMIAALLALAELRRASGRTVVRAIHAAYETSAALRRGGLQGNLLRTRHIDQILTTLGAAAGAGVVLGLDLPRMANAMALALTPNLPLRVTRTGLISEWKSCATAHGVMNAVFAARLAEQGLTGPPEPFEGLAGMQELLDLPVLNLSTIGQPREGRTALESTGLKAFPAEYSADGPLASMVQLREDVAASDIHRVIVSLPWSGWHEIGGGVGDRDYKWNPTTRELADHSLPYLLAVVFLDGDLTVDSFGSERFADPALRSLMQQITVREDPDLTRAHAGELPHWPWRLELQLLDGRQLIQESEHPRGHPLNPLCDGEVTEKFLRLAEGAVPEAVAGALLDAAWRLPELATIGELTGLFRLCATGAGSEPEIGRAGRPG